MALLTKYGSFWGYLPMTSGRIFWVAPGTSYTIEGQTLPASNDQDGLSPERAFSTLAYAVLSTRSNPMVAGDVVVLLPGLHSNTATVTISTNGIIVTGIPGSIPRFGSRRSGGGKRNISRIANTTTAGTTIDVAADDVEIAWLHLAPAAGGGQGINVNIGADRTYIHDCTTALVATASTTTYGIAFGTAATGVCEDTLIANCYFQSGLSNSSGANGPAISGLCTVYGLTIEQSTFELKGTAAWASAITTVSAGSLGVAIRDCDFINPTSATTVITTAITTTGQTIDGSTQVHRCYIPAGTDGCTASAMVDIVLTESYTANSSGGTILLNG
jgi:hypothetical protein